MRKRIFTWHVHGSYLFFLSHGDFDVYIPVKPQAEEGYYGRGNTFPFGRNVIEIPFHEVKSHEFDLILYQTDRNYLQDQYEVLSTEQRKLPKIFLKHDPPWHHPTDEKLVIREPGIAVVHVTHFNRLMWDSTPFETRVIIHGVADTGVTWKGDFEKGLVVINNLPARGRLLGLDIFNEVRKEIPLDIVGLGAEPLGGREVLHPQLPEFMSHYRFFFNPIRYTSLGLALCEAMMVGLPPVVLATTELPAVIQNDVNGYIHTDTRFLVEKMKMLLNEPEEAKRISRAARETAISLFDLRRFTGEWEELVNEMVLSHQLIEKSV